MSGCNCSKKNTTLSVRQRIRREFKEKVSDIKRMWNESSGGKITVGGDTLGFKNIK